MFFSNYFLSFSGFFIAERQVLTMMHLFGIGQAYKPYLTNMRQRVVATHIYIRPFGNNMSIGIFTLYAAQSCR
jgi:hypothetical protein